MTGMEGVRQVWKGYDSYGRGMTVMEGVELLKGYESYLRGKTGMEGV